MEGPLAQSTLDSTLLKSADPVLSPCTQSSSATCRASDTFSASVLHVAKWWLSKAGIPTPPSPRCAFARRFCSRALTSAVSTAPSPAPTPATSAPSSSAATGLVAPTGSVRTVTRRNRRPGCKRAYCTSFPKFVLTVALQATSCTRPLFFARLCCPGDVVSLLGDVVPSMSSARGIKLCSPSPRVSLRRAFTNGDASNSLFRIAREIETCGLPSALTGAGSALPACGRSTASASSTTSVCRLAFARANAESRCSERMSAHRPAGVASTMRASSAAAPSKGDSVCGGRRNRTSPDSAAAMSVAAKRDSCILNVGLCDSSESSAQTSASPWPRSRATVAI
mmetsp:Transcript_30517/g.76401  ORF Transcript_30517/g.76401 Transcript_30517/m.76401 type:complete len:338 (-) Transcript_30517:333-1346(-)